MSDAPAMLVMAKAPRAGYAKTRLAPLLGEAGAAALQAQLVQRATALAAAVAPGRALLAHAPADAGDELRALAAPGVELIPQRGGDLGERLAHATAAAWRRHPGPLVVVGVDAPALAPAHVRAATAELARGVDACLGPARDGGYYLLALARPLPELFAIDPDAWGGGRVLELTLAAAQAAGVSASLLWPERDLDEPEDVAAALAEGELAPELAALVAGAAVA